MSLPTPYTVKRHAFTPSPNGGYDGPGTWDAVGEEIAVHGWSAPGADSVPHEQQRTPVIRDLDLLVPPGTPGRPNDRWVIEGTEYDQVGHIEDYTRGPFRYEAGLRINLKRAEG